MERHIVAISSWCLQLKTVEHIKLWIQNIKELYGELRNEIIGNGGIQNIKELYGELRNEIIGNGGIDVNVIKNNIHQDNCSFNN